MSGSKNRCLPAIGDVIRTTSIQQMYEVISQLSGTSRADCTDTAMAALIAAIQSVEPNSVIFVFTDGAARDFASIDSVLAAALNKTVRVRWILPDGKRAGFHCALFRSTLSSPARVRSTRQSTTLSLDWQLQLVGKYSESTRPNLIILRLDLRISLIPRLLAKQVAFQILQYTKRQLKQNFTIVDMTQFTDRGSLVIPTDAGMDELIVSATGTNVALQMNASKVA